MSNQKHLTTSVQVHQTHLHDVLHQWCPAGQLVGLLAYAFLPVQLLSSAEGGLMDRRRRRAQTWRRKWSEFATGCAIKSSSEGERRGVRQACLLAVVSHLWWWERPGEPCWWWSRCPQGGSEHAGSVCSGSPLWCLRLGLGLRQKVHVSQISDTPNSPSCFLAEPRCEKGHFFRKDHKRGTV